MTPAAPRLDNKAMKTRWPILTALIALQVCQATTQSTSIYPAPIVNKRECENRGGDWGGACYGSLEALGLPAETSEAIMQALRAEAEQDIEVVEAVRHRRDGREAVCGLYTTRGSKWAHYFAWSEGKLITAYGPSWNIGTVCLISNYNMPLP